MAAQETLLNGRYRLIAQQASGGMAVVYKAQDLALGRTVAVKILRPSLTGDSAFLARFRQEARNVANLAHPNIVTVHDFQQDGNTYYIVMEYVEGQDLKKLIRASAPFQVDRALNIAIQICAGIGYAHRAGLVHADVKPQNVLITPDDHVKVTDFGIAQALSMTQPQEKQSVVWGSPHYFAPEQASGELPTPASDVYSIGIVMFEMLTGKLPYNGTDQQELALAHIRDTVPHVMDFNPRVPVHLDRIIYKVMSKDPAARYRTADQLGRILIAYKQQGTEPTMDQPVVNPQALPPAPVIPPKAAQPAASAPQSAAAIPSAAQASAPPPAQQGYTPPPAYTPPPVPTSRQTNSSTGASKPVSAIPPAPQPYSQQPQAQPYPAQSYNPPKNTYNDAYAAAPDANIANANVRQPTGPNYQVAPPPAPVDMVTIILGVIAFLAVIGLIPLWLAVLNAYSRG